jgi:hypothetical protein
MDVVLAAVLVCRTAMFLTEDIYVHMRQHRLIRATTTRPETLAALITTETFAASRDYAMAKSSFQLGYGGVR